MSESKEELSYGQAKILSEIIYRWLNEQFNDLQYESISNKGLCRTFVKEVAGYVDKRYLSGNYIAIQPFSIYLFTDGSDTRTRLNAGKSLNDICDWLVQQNASQSFPVLGDHDFVTAVEIDSNPYLIERNDSEYVYRMIFTVQYQHKN